MNKTIESVKNLVEAVKHKGELIFTLGNVNAPYIDKVERLLNDSFSEVESKTYGRFNESTYFSYILAMLMIIVPKLRLSDNNLMKFYSCRGRFKK